ncbi:unnamed protein product [Effrenium voratum]|uniref:Uncharacterized protein n=1 Tax=Effrenium voratum TaxID=2562239 RepID=A0AA36I401_9DINO|nr:unnamed protein product [Effrenium voratum]
MKRMDEMVQLPTGVGTGRQDRAAAHLEVQGLLHMEAKRLASLCKATGTLPVLAKTTLVLMLQWTACHNVPVWNGNSNQPSLQGEPDTERPACIYMAPPKDGIALAAAEEWRDKSLLYQLTAPVYGQANAPRRWYLHVLRTLLDRQWQVHTLDPCFVLMIKLQRF